MISSAQKRDFLAIASPATRRRPKVRWKNVIVVATVMGAAFVSIAYQEANAATLQFISDTISTSRPATSSNHMIQFSATTPIPPSGKIVIVSENSFFTIPSGLDYTDVDIATSTALNGAFSERLIGPTASSSADSVLAVSGTSGSITIILNSNFGIPAGAFVRIEIGTNATSGITGDQQVINPSIPRSYAVEIYSKDATNAILDYGKTIIAIVNPVAITVARQDTDPPILSNGLPTGELSHTVTQVEISVETNEVATCRYSPSSGNPYASMANFTDTRSTIHRTNIGSVASGNSYSFYVKCEDLFLNEDMVDFVISFSVRLPPATSSVPPGGGGAGGSAPFPPTPGPPEVLFDGWAYPSATIVILVDGKQQKTVSASANGKFSTPLTLETQGTYTFGLYAKDSSGRKSLTKSYTLTVVGGTRTTISNILFEPTLGIAKNTLDAGEPLDASGASIPLSTVELLFAPQAEEDIHSPALVRKSTAADQTGFWKFAYDTAGLRVDTYSTRARFTLVGVGTSDFGTPVYFGIGKAPAPDFCGRADINKDSRVQLTDFSILLFHWGTDHDIADINLDQKVNLTDFSIMLFCWTG